LEKKSIYSFCLLCAHTQDGMQFVIYSHLFSTFLAATFFFVTLDEQGYYQKPQENVMNISLL